VPPEIRVPALSLRSGFTYEDRVRTVRRHLDSISQQLKLNFLGKAKIGFRFALKPATIGRSASFDRSVRKFCNYYGRKQVPYPLNVELFINMKEETKDDP